MVIEISEDQKRAIMTQLNPATARLFMIMATLCRLDIAPRRFSISNSALSNLTVDFS